MVFSFVYLVFVSLLKLLLRSGRRVDVKDIELLLLRHQLDVMGRQVERRNLRLSDRAVLAGAGRLLPPRRRHGLLVTPQTLRVGTASLCGGDGHTRARGQGARRSTPERASLCCGWRARTRAGAISGSPASSTSSGSRSRQARSAACSRAPSSGRRRDARAPAGVSSCARRRRASSRATSSALRPPCCAATTCSSSSSCRPAACTSPRHRQPGRPLGHPAGAQPQPLRRARRRQVPDPRPRHEVRGRVRRGLPHRRRQGDPNAVPRATGQRPRRALRADRTDGVPGLAADPRPATPRPGPARLRRPLQHRAPTPRARATPAARDPAAKATTAAGSDRATRPTRRPPPRIPPRRSMTNPRFGTLQG